MMQFTVHLGENIIAGEALRFCSAALSNARFVGDSEIRIDAGGVDVWNEPEDDPDELHVAIHAMTRKGMAVFGSLVFHLTQRYSRTTWVLDD